MSAPAVPLFDWQIPLLVLRGALDSNVQIQPGPPSYEGTQDTVGRAVVITVGGGPGLALDNLFDRVTVALDIAGEQEDPSDAARLANLADLSFVRIDRTTTIGGLRVLSVQRAGGRPTPIDVDDGDRWHYGCSYVWQVASGV